MSIDILSAVLVAIAGVLGTAVAWLAYRETKRGKREQDNNERLRQIIGAALEPLKEQVTQVNNRMDHIVERQNQVDSKLDKVADAQGKLLDRTTALETKVEVFWRNVAMDTAKIIHSPNPARRHVDELLEKFMEDLHHPGYMTREDRDELKRVLIAIRDYEPGMKADFPIKDTEQHEAALLLNLMELLHPRSYSE